MENKNNKTEIRRWQLGAGVSEVRELAHLLSGSSVAVKHS